jgi:hypothetical protein
MGRTNEVLLEPRASPRSTLCFLLSLVLLTDEGTGEVDGAGETVALRNVTLLSILLSTPGFSFSLVSFVSFVTSLGVSLDLALLLFETVAGSWSATGVAGDLDLEALVGNRMLCSRDERRRCRVRWGGSGDSGC